MYRRRFIVALAMLLGACNSDEQVAKEGVQPVDQNTVAATRPSAAQALTKAAKIERPDVDTATLAMGQQLFLQHCAQCHGEKAGGAPNWQQPDPEGKYPAPPLNGTGHAWHHPMQALRHTIRQGTIRMGGNMPAWGSELTNEQIDAIIFWFQFQWPDEIYQAWARMDRQKGGS